MKIALDEMVVDGVRTTVPVHQMILDDRLFLRGQYHTQLLDRLLDRWQLKQKVSPAEVAGIYVALSRVKRVAGTTATADLGVVSRWRTGLQEPNSLSPALYIEGV